ncbi:threonine synthase [Terrarubrum flagellatum]|uniref:threonine synthase n=1 Tax=Terrirubrum flagellatum TaxID=2895980 RepID=UPI00314515A3
MPDAGLHTATETPADAGDGAIRKDAPAASLNPRFAGFRCIRCGADFPTADYPEGCPICLERGYPASVAAAFSPLPRIDALPSKRGMRRFAERLPYRDFISLGEGDTPLVSLPRLAAEFGVANLHIKLEGANPTGSHKDRMSAQFIARALDRGASSVVAASSGNAGVSLAAYAAAAGIRCVIVATNKISSAWRNAIEAMGATVTIVDDPLERWRLIKDKVKSMGWMSATNYLDPPVGSEPFGVSGYRTLAYELAETPLSAAADTIIVPTARGDLLWGLYQGFHELMAEGILPRIPRLVAAEPFARLEKVMAGADYRSHFEGATALSSIGGVTVTYQSQLAVERSGGTVAAVDSDQALRDVERLARNGVYLESSAAASLTALRALRERKWRALTNVVLIGTSHGFKNSAN